MGVTWVDTDLVCPAHTPRKLERHTLLDRWRGLDYLSAWITQAVCESPNIASPFAQCEYSQAGRHIANQAIVNLFVICDQFGFAARDERSVPWLLPRASMYRNAYAGAKKYKAGISPPVRRVSRQATGGSRGGVVTVSHLRHWSPCRARRGVGT
ncbi:hypothetical protein GWK47_052539 [Chionoecetes opilio]|uniref:Uncharacterized protein n=1 Tax=Chionoecetes opilio TaxID=41210 RepID=A0A8J4Y6B7_CHIOP|nr:hypothetical protein GWK47_052539 [Chionoecetes opilio]